MGKFAFPVCPLTIKGHRAIGFIQVLGAVGTSQEPLRLGQSGGSRLPRGRQGQMGTCERASAVLDWGTQELVVSQSTREQYRQSASAYKKHREPLAAFLWFQFSGLIVTFSLFGLCCTEAKGSSKSRIKHFSFGRRKLTTIFRV